MLEMKHAERSGRPGNLMNFFFLLMLLPRSRSTILKKHPSTAALPPLRMLEMKHAERNGRSGILMHLFFLLMLLLRSRSTNL
jgi:hypothetical protein